MKRQNLVKRSVSSNYDKSNGFTIIETMFFLAITGLLAMAVLVGASGSINGQRYRDSITSLQSFLQDQYSEVSNVLNSRDKNWKCNSGTIVASTSGIARGQTECVMLGRLIVSDGTKTLKVSQVVGAIPNPDLTATLTDIEVLGTAKGYGTYISNIEQQSYTLEWGSAIMDSTGHDFTAGFSILIVRSPITGNIRTFIDKTASIVSNSQLQTRLASGVLSPSTNIKLCVDPTGLFKGVPNAIQIMGGAASASGVESLGDGGSACVNHV